MSGFIDRLLDAVGDGSSDRVLRNELSVHRRSVPAKVVRAVDHGAAVEHGRGIVRAAQVRALEHVAKEAMSAVGHLSQEEAFWVRHVPHAAARLQAIADLASMGLADIVTETGRE